MNANEVIEAYVTDVAERLPRKQRNDVAFELRALLTEELQDKAQGAGRDADAAMAIELVRAFGPPVEVAARYRPTLTIIDPADGHRFLWASVIGLVVIWCAGLLSQLRQPDRRRMGRPHRPWPLVDQRGDSFPVVARRAGGRLRPLRMEPPPRPQASEWKPRAPDSIHGGRASVVIGLLGVLFGTYVLVNPHWVLDFFWGGNAAPAAYQALTYTENFLRYQGPILLALILVNVPLMLAVILSGRRSALLHRLELGFSLLTCAAMLWVVADGPILMAATSDQTAKACMVLIVAFVLIHMGVKLYRSVRPTPDQQMHGLR